MHLLAALLAAALPLAANGQAQLLPFGKFAARDGRPGPGKHWEVSDAQGSLIATQLNAIAARTPIVIDYDHQTIRAETNGLPAPAAGWIKSVEWRAGAGLFSSVEWTPAAKARIDSGEYRYISPVITFDKQDGSVTGLLLAALVNHPALLGMEPVVAQLAARITSHTSEPTMTLLAALIASLGIAADAKDADVINHVAALKTKAEAPPKAVLPAALSTALGLQAGADEAAALSAITTLRAGGDTANLQAMTALQGQVATLSSKLNERDVLELVDGAIAAYKLLPAQRDWALSLGKANLAQLKGFIDSAVVIPGLDGQSKGKEREGEGTAALSATAAKVIASMGITAEQYAAAAPKA